MRYIFPFLITSIICSQSIHQMEMSKYNSQVQTGLDILINERLDLIKGKKVGLVTNHTGVDRNGKPNYKIFMQLDNVHLKAIFAPEHGFFGNVSRGKKIADKKSMDFPTIFSLYGKTRKPTPEMLTGLDVIIYDIQDIGARFYTYISTLGMVLEAAGEAGLPVIVLDRPNPINGNTIEGPLLDLNYKSFVGMYPISIRYGLTVGELAKMIVSEKWINTIPEITVIEMENWQREMYFDETGLRWIPPSPNIPDMETAIRYPGLCLVEGTNVSEGRGTEHPFKYIGAPWINSEELVLFLTQKHLQGVSFKPISYTPAAIKGKTLKPKYENEVCKGVSVIITDRLQYDSIVTGIHIIKAIEKLYPDQFQWNDYIFKLWGKLPLLEYNNEENDTLIHQAAAYKLYD